MDQMENILVVEDSLLQGKKLMDLLSTHGFEADLCETGACTLEKLGHKDYDMILLDMVLPDTSGTQLIKKIKTTSDCGHIPIIVLSGLTDKENVIESLGMGINDYITKPYHDKELINRMNIHLKFQRTQKGLSMANAANDKFLSVLGHDLKNSFSVLYGAIDLLDGQHDDNFQNGKILSEAKATTLRVNTLLDELLLWGKVINKGVVQHNERLDVNAHVAEVISKYGEEILHKGIEIIENIDGEAFVVADKNMIEAAVRNLLSNAKKFTKKGGSITITSEIFNRADEKFHKLSVSDTGKGMTDLTLDNLFSGTYQKATQDTEGNLGMGLGLSIVKDFIEKNAGEIKVKSRIGEGSTFSLYLPAVE